MPVAFGAGARSTGDDDEKVRLLELPIVRSWSRRSVLDGMLRGVGRAAGVEGVKRRALRASVRRAMVIEWRRRRSGVVTKGCA